MRCPGARGRSPRASERRPRPSRRAVETKSRRTEQRLHFFVVVNWTPSEESTKAKGRVCLHPREGGGVGPLVLPLATSVLRSTRYENKYYFRAIQSVESAVARAEVPNNYYLESRVNIYYLLRAQKADIIGRAEARRAEPRGPPGPSGRRPEGCEAPRRPQTARRAVAPTIIIFR